MKAGAGDQGKHPRTPPDENNPEKVPSSSLSPEGRPMEGAVFGRDAGFEAANQQLPGFSPGGHAVLIGCSPLF